MKSLFYLLGLWSVVLAAPRPELRVLESLQAIPQGWVQNGSVPAAYPLRFRLAIKQENAYAFEQHVIDISTPGHAKYGQHMSHTELKRMLRPSKDASNAILGWLDAAGVPPSSIEDDGDWINFRVPVIAAEKMLDTKFHYYTSQANGLTRIRTLHYSVPDSIRPYVHMIQPTTRFDQMRTQRSMAFKIDDGPEIDAASLADPTAGSLPGGGLNATFCNTTITPTCLRELYNIGKFQGSLKNGNLLGIAGYLEQYAKYADLEQFVRTYTPEENPAIANFTYVLINGGLSTQNDTVDSDVEANLDVQYAIPLAYKTKAVYYSTGGRGQLVPDLDQPTLADDQNEPYLDFLHYLLALPDSQLPKTLTSSYGEDEQSVPEAYTNATCNMFAQLGARGVSVLFSSGDTGVGSACQTNDGKNTTRFLPIFPAACPFVTSVGGTYRVEPERAIAFSSGGFSDRFPRPAYQNAAVTKYLSILGSQWEGLYNPAGRGFPDIAAQSYNFSVIDAGKVIRVGGTSASSPAVAGIVSLLNSARLSAGEKPLGFLNPWIYSIGRFGLTDITVGGSRGCTGRDQYSGLPTPFVPFASFNATPGWDPVTGYGTPNFKALLPLALLKH